MVGRIGPDWPGRPWGLTERGEGTRASAFAINGLGRAKRRVAVCHELADGALKGAVQAKSKSRWGLLLA